jgi:oxygen-independent coproporphyrinogen-3 oxidase
MFIPYPHKTSYRPINPPIELKQVWVKENKQALFLYIHIPFCEMRCGFCNLFTTVKNNQELFEQYVQAVNRQALQVKTALGPSNFARFALGGGTPTQLSVSQLEAVLNIAEKTMGARLLEIPGSVEVSPETVNREKLKLLRDRGITRVSIGVQSFIDAEVLAVQRRQNSSQVKAALTLMAEANFPIINIDLIYGLPGQTVESWVRSLREALQFQPQELYLYPLYVRPLTGLGKTPQEWDDIRLACYREGRSLLLSEGYTQVSLRMFRKTDLNSNSGPVYCCQSDGMIGLGCGARSYTEHYHYSGEYAVSDAEIRQILTAFIQSPDSGLGLMHYGFKLDAEDRRRRYVLLSLLSEAGVNLKDYTQRFNTDIFEDLSELSELLDLNLAIVDNQRLCLTESGIERSDTIGYWLFSDRVRALIKEYQLK